MAKIFEGGFRSQLPVLDGLILTAGEKMGVVGGKRNGRRGPRVSKGRHRLAEIRADRLTGIVSYVPGKHRLVGATGGEHLIIRAKSEAPHRPGRFELSQQ